MPCRVRIRSPLTYFHSVPISLHAIRLQCVRKTPPAKPSKSHISMTKNNLSILIRQEVISREPSTATDTKGARAWPAQDWMDGEGTITTDTRNTTGSAGGEGGRERSAGEARRATGGARKPPAQPRVQPRVFAVKSPQASKHPNFQASPSARKPPAQPRVFAVPSWIGPVEDRRLIHSESAADPPWIRG